MREILILEAGVVGMTSAYALARNGFAVTVIDAGSSPAEGGASFGNGSQLSYSYTDARHRLLWSRISQSICLGAIQHSEST
ncbi:FAD-dependent oxidoreductase [Mesorhizobium sp. M0317]|uniref:FAD-dependent oxidoreductase n=1 Tax=Mesorhizobium sp. M0317 TaxID=2956935 RepID=UPI003337383F